MTSLQRPSTPEHDREVECARRWAELQMTSTTHHRECAAVATASRMQDPPPPPPQPSPQPPPHHPVEQSAMDPFAPPNPSPRDAVAAIHAQLAAGPQPIPMKRRYDNQTASSSNVPLGSAAMVQLHVQAPALGTGVGSRHNVLPLQQPTVASSS